MGWLYLHPLCLCIYNLYSIRSVQLIGQGPLALGRPICLLSLLVQRHPHGRTQSNV